MGVAGRAVYGSVKFAIYLGVAFSVLFPRIPDHAPRDFVQWLILVGALVAISLAVSSTMDWVRDTALDITARRRSKRDERD